MAPATTPSCSIVSVALMALLLAFSGCPDGTDAELSPTPIPTPTPFPDSDGDGVRPGEGDCDDTDPTVYSGARDVYNQRDDDCDGQVDEDCCGIFGELSVLDAAAWFMGETSNDYAGYALSLSGDLDGDGLDDIVIGAPQADLDPENELTWDAGRVYIYYSPVFGAHLLADAPDRIDGSTGMSYLGFDLASSADTGADDRDDLVVGAPFGHTAGASLGAAYLFQGPVTGHLDANDAMTSFGGTTSTEAALGWGVGMGDADGDGLAELVSGAPGEELAGIACGAAWVWKDRPEREQDLSDATAGVYGTPDSFLGSALDLRGDLNGDGMPDLVVGARETSTLGCRRGEVYVFYGPIKGDLQISQANARLFGAHLADRAGTSVSTGDVDGDGIDDLLVGAPGAEDLCQQSPVSHLDQGFAYLVYGPVEGEIDLGQASATIEGVDVDDKLGFRVALNGDLDGDGRSDIVVAADLAELESGQGAGAVYVFYGPQSGHHYASEADATIRGTLDVRHLGLGLATGGDVNGDGYGDVLIGGGIDAGSSPGSSYLFLGGPRN